MALVELSGAVTILADTDTYALSTLDYPSQVILPHVDDGTNDTVAVGKTYTIQTETHPVEILTHDLFRVGVVPPWTTAVVAALAGEDEDLSDDVWSFNLRATAPAEYVEDAETEHSSGGDADMDALGEAINAILAVLRREGLMMPEAEEEE